MNNILRTYTFLDNLCLGVDQALRAVSGASKTSGRPYPANALKDQEMTLPQRNYSAALMRINHAGEVCAQALYHGQGLGSRNRLVKEKMRRAALEEGDHLAWCAKRLTELHSHTSYLNPFWYASSFAIGLSAGMIGDQWSLGFLAETENQVVQHLEKQLGELPATDQKSQMIINQMQQDEANHRDDAMQAGAAELPTWLKRVMQFTAKIMVKTAFWI